MTADLVLVGGGLANCLVAYRLAELRPDLDILLLERGPTLGGHHTWSHHEHDLTDAQRRWIGPLIDHSWPRHEVRFPGRDRVLNSGYSTISSGAFGETIRSSIGERARVGVEVRHVAQREVTLDDGTIIAGSAVIDGRGDPGSPHLDIGFQKFLGRFMTLDHEHRLTGPILMDATVNQCDGYRFIYTLPFSETTLLIEDTRYSDTPELHRDSMREAVGRYAEGRGWSVLEVTDEEEGVLPVVLSGDIERFWRDGPQGVPRSGMRAALFHPTTGYSFAEAVRMADDLASLESLTGDTLYGWTKRRSIDLWRRTGYFRLLNRMLFRAAEPDQRYRVLERFYGLGEPLIRRFYSGRLRWTDKLRLVVGSPPVPIGRALGCILDRRTRPNAGAPVVPE